MNTGDAADERSSRFNHCAFSAAKRIPLGRKML
jgi:hypothetical protein